MRKSFGMIDSLDKYLVELYLRRLDALAFGHDPSKIEAEIVQVEAEIQRIRENVSLRHAQTE